MQVTLKAQIIVLLLHESFWPLLHFKQTSPMLAWFSYAEMLYLHHSSSNLSLLQLLLIKLALVLCVAECRTEDCGATHDLGRVVMHSCCGKCVDCSLTCLAFVYPSITGDAGSLWALTSSCPPEGLVSVVSGRLFTMTQMSLNRQVFPNQQHLSGF